MAIEHTFDSREVRACWQPRSGLSPKGSGSSCERASMTAWWRPASPRRPRTTPPPRLI
ncbi:hypothetical protein ACFFX0_31925 [Citricoccus parietis]|uniref:Uncharacterized protein n=1 Tax=Citricoccus parietis TaxID=592307 RepID=A0ABV5G984_9MICC